MQNSARAYTAALPSCRFRLIILVVMTERDILLHCLDRVASRLRLNRYLREGAWLVCGVCGVLFAYQCVKMLVGAREVMRALMPLFVLTGLVLCALFALRVARRPTRAQAAALVDARVDLKDELKSAYWFVDRGIITPAVAQLLRGAARSAGRIDPRATFPLVIPQSIYAALLLALMAYAAAWLPVVSEKSGARSLFSALDRLGPTPLAHAPTQERSDLAQGGAQQVDARGAMQEQGQTQTEAQVPSLDNDTGSIQPSAETRSIKPALQRLETQAAMPAEKSAQPEGQQVSEAFSESILRRLREMFSQDEALVDANASNRAHQQALARVSGDSVQTGDDQKSEQNAARLSANETALNSALRAAPGSARGDRQTFDAESDNEQQGGRGNSGGGAMGRRINTSQRGAGDGEPGRDSGASPEPVLGARSLRLATQLQRVRVESKDDQTDQGTPEAFYAATRAQAARLDYQDAGEPVRAASEAAMNQEQTPDAYREAVKKYSLARHAQEK